MSCAIFLFILSHPCVLDFFTLSDDEAGDDSKGRNIGNARTGALKCNDNKTKTRKSLPNWNLPNRTART